jgi:predicted nucleotidyltransferase
VSTYAVGMPVLDEAALSDVERRALDRIVGALRGRLGDDLVAIWLYGSRARGESHPESDLDLLVVVQDGNWRREHEVMDVVWDAAEEVGASSAYFSVIVGTPEWIEGRRQIRSFFLQEVDRDKIVLYGEP